MMNPRSNHPSRKGQAGFSMVELLMTAFILAVGILGLSMLQVMSLKAARGSQSLTTAVQVGEQVMDRIEMESRLSWLNATNTEFSTPQTLSNLKYIDKASFTTPLLFNIKGETADDTSTDLHDHTFYTVTMANTVVSNNTTGAASDVVLTVSFADAVNKSNVKIPRKVVITRRLAHG